MMAPYPIRCYQKRCPNVAIYKIAAQWSDGIIGELKTYGLVCARCLPEWYRRSVMKQASCRRAPHEQLDTPGIYRLDRNKRDAQLERLREMEAQLRSTGSDQLA